jgi:hypothetical protein
MQNQKEKLIGEIKFVVTAFTAVEAFRLKSFLLGKFGPSLGQLLGTLDNILPSGKKISEINFSGIKIDGDKAAKTIERLMAELNEDEFEAFLRRMLQNTVAIKGKNQFVFAEEQFETSMNIVFTGRLFSVYPVLLLVLEANYPDFFDKMGRGFGKKILTTLTSELDDENLNNESERSET